MAGARNQAGERSAQKGDAAALLWALHGIAGLAARGSEPAAALREALALLCPAAGFFAGDVLLTDGAAGFTGAGGAVHGGRTAFQASCAGLALRAGQALAGRASEGRAAAWSADLAGDPRALEREGVRSMVACPIAEGGPVVGTLELFSDSAEPPDALVLAAVEQAAVLLGGLVRRAQPGALLTGDESFRAIFESAGVGFALGTAEGTVIRVNRAYADFLGSTPDQLAGRNLRDLIDSEHVTSTMHELRELVAHRVDRLDLERRYLRSDGTRLWGRTTLTLLPGTALVIAVVQNVEARRQAEEAIRGLSGRFLHLQDEERRRIARALHESAAQTVAALSMNLQRMERMALPPQAAESLADTLGLAAQTSREIRTLSHLLHPPLLEEAGLPSSLRWLVQGFGQRSAVEVTLDIADDLGRLSTELEITLFRIVQESLTNVHRHSGSPSASVRLRRSGPEVVVEIEDQGIGVPSEVRERVYAANPGAVGVGIAGMRERLSQLGGKLEILRASPGTLVRARIRSE